MCSALLGKALSVIEAVLVWSFVWVCVLSYPAPIVGALHVGLADVKARGTR